MKNLEEIERMDIGFLESVSEDVNVRIPDGLSKKIEDTVLAAGLQESCRKRTVFWPAFSVAMTVAVACLSIILYVNSQPKDTFTDPSQAYAELEKTLSFISSKMDRGLELAAEAKPIVETTNNAINR